MSRPSEQTPLAAFALSQRQGGLALFCLVGLVGTVAVAKALTLAFWYDEVATAVMARLPSFATLWDALGHAADGSPPLYHLLVRLSATVIGDDHLAYRLPSIVAAMITMTAVYRLLADRLDRLSALTGVGFLLTTVFQSYVTEARPYALLLAAVAVAVFAWQRIEESSRYVLVLFLALAAAISFHYYAVFVWPAFAAAESCVAWRRKQIRWPVWAAIIVALLPLAFTFSLLDSYRQAYVAHYWAKANVATLVQTYVLLPNLLTPGAGLFFGLLGWTFTIRRKLAALAPRNDVRKLQAEEAVLILGLVGVPIVALVVAIVTGGGLAPRYGLPMLIGAVMAVGHASARIPALFRVMLIAVSLTTWGISAAPIATMLATGERPRIDAALEVADIAQRSGHSDLPLVISDGLRFLPMAFYTPADSPVRPHLMLDPPAALRMIQTDSVDLTLTYLRVYCPDFLIEDYETFTARHSEFILVAGQGHAKRGADFDWWPDRLRQDGHTVESVYKAEGSHVFRVQLRGNRQVPTP